MIPEDIVERVYDGTATKEDALTLLKVKPFELYALADQIRSETVGDNVTYVVNRNINFTDRCIGTCGFCAFKDKKGYLLTQEQIKEKIDEAVAAGATELCIQGGLMKDVKLDLYLDILRAVKEDYPHIHTHCFSPMEVYHAATSSGLTIEETLAELKENGLNTMPGTAAEILVDRVREIVCPGKITRQQWINVITSAHQAGIRTTSTMMYGHVETWEERIDHILTIRDVQKKTGGITEFVPLPFMPYNNIIGDKILKEGKFMTTGTEDLKVYALARILLNKHVENIQTSWVKLGKKLAQVALLCGGNDLGGTLIEESISKSAGASNGEVISVKELEWIIRGIDRTPVQRDTLYRSI
ncbi:5-amino-6-(D-ribitylamino)uracil--L-tyrosine 4-hydroxyphenyl transferase CofH [Methanococcoides methylutens]|uniref:5-amino-6-(D-ribitylamino)uracil--L-tyrosine 4-hydroxyphenyl transferase n=1 Tax=Methanococcoides methylutens MM1 TaxID=1434104 RepID=A0A0E3WZZ7_METMT|nr:5-amino-6-(D-ribitylamino)uracil--L-tyrosine 4-hydroxyphenyl transferase CofH [Methanococcoides methylutens]AKB85305.1 7,8-didemethyl-8-hydroxy-5-deazariboflavin synthase subunit 2 [Methanococcoides methylutens MM1]